MSGFEIRRDEDDIGVGSHRFMNSHDEKTRRHTEFRCTMKSLNQTFVTACQDEISRAPDCVLVPLIQNYLLYLRDTLTKLNEDSNDVDTNSFTNIGKFYDSFTKKLHRFTYTMDKSVFNNNNKELPPLKRRADGDKVRFCGSSPLNNLNASLQMNTPLSAGFSNRLSSREGKIDTKINFSATTSTFTANEPVQSDRNTFSGLCGFNSASAQPTTSPNYFSDNSKQPFNAGFMVSGPSRSPSSFSLPSSSKANMGPPQANYTPVFKRSPIINHNICDPNLNSSTSRMSNQNSPVQLSKSSAVRVTAPLVFPSPNAFGMSSNYTNGINPSLAPILPKSGGFDLGASKSFPSLPQSTSGINFSFSQQPTPVAKPLTGFSFAPAAISRMKPPQPAVNNKDSDDEDTEPPKNEFKPVVESDSLYNTKCKVFSMMGGIYKDRGVGQLYVKKTENGKYQLVVRADNTLGTVILNLLLSKTLPLSKKSAKDIITVDPQGNKGEPSTVLIRVKDESSATELLNKLTQFKSSSS